jgi:dienelactone hydrolase
MICLTILVTVTGPRIGRAQGEPRDIRALLRDSILSPAVAEFQVRQFIMTATTPPPRAPATPNAWTTEATRLRQHLLNDVVFHGWPKAWVESAPKFDDVGVIETGAGYRIHRLRYEIVPGFYSAALLYEPDHITGKIPAILSVSGHDGPLGYTSEFKQKRHIAWAKHGAIVLTPEWFSFGELNQPFNDHNFIAHLSLVGTNGLGIFYLEMRRALDYLYNHASVDRNRIGMTGLSGGGWQTIVLSSLDERIRAANPVAGFSSLRTRIEVKEYGDIGDLEQSPPDFLQGSDFSHLVALMAPRPMLLSYNAEDDCCFRAGMVKERIFDAIRPMFKLYGKDDAFTWHENTDPGTHNFEIDNRLAAYAFFSKHLGLPAIENEAGIPAELRSYDELKTGLPKDNLTILGVARRLAKEITRDPVPSDVSALANWATSQRTKLKDVVRYKPVDIQTLWHIAMTKHRDVQSMSYVFGMNNQLSASGILMRSTRQSSDSAPTTILLDDRGKDSTAYAASRRFLRGDQVLSLELMFFGTAWSNVSPWLFAQGLDAVGDRTIGLQAAQLIKIAHWAKERAGGAQLRVETDGIRSQGGRTRCGCLGARPFL